MKKNKFLRVLLVLLTLAFLLFAGTWAVGRLSDEGFSLDTARGLLNMEPREVAELRRQEVPQKDEGHQE